MCINDKNHHLNLARNLLAARWPEAIGAFAGGSILRGQGRPNSDIDMIVLMPRQEKATRGWLRHEGVPFDIFRHDEETLRCFVAQDWHERRPVLLNIMAEAHLLPAPNPVLRKWQRYARLLLRHGPPHLNSAEWAMRRYLLMDRLDDYADAAMHDRPAIHAELYLQLQDCICDLGNRWRGNSKWRPRWARKADAELLEQVDKAYVDGNFRIIGHHLLDLMGGPLRQEQQDEAPAEKRQARLRLLE